MTQHHCPDRCLFYPQQDHRGQTGQMNPGGPGGGGEREGSLSLGDEHSALAHSLVNKVNCLSCGQPGVWQGGKCWNITLAGNYYHLLNIQTTAPVRLGQHQANYQSPVSPSLRFSVHQHISLYTNNLSPRPPAIDSLFSSFFLSNFFSFKECLVLH